MLLVEEVLQFQVYLRILNQLDNIALTNDWSTELDNNNVGKLLIHNNQLFISYDGKIVTVDSL